jgi:3-methyladenine DNA glycosylase AlkD
MHSIAHDVDRILASLRGLASKRFREEMATRYGIHTAKAFGVPMGAMQKLALRFRAGGKRKPRTTAATGETAEHAARNHALAAALWDSGWYEARIVAAFLDEPQCVTPAQMDRWRRDFDNWGICDTVCFHLFDRTPHAFAKIAQWSRLRDEFGKRAAFALLASVALHDKQRDDEPFARCLSLIERAAADDRNFVKKGVSWALRGIGHRSPSLHAAAVSLAQQLAESPQPAARWVGKDALRDLARPLVLRRFATSRRHSRT